MTTEKANRAEILGLGRAQGIGDFALDKAVERLRTDFPKHDLRLRTDWREGLCQQVADGSLDAALVLVSASSRPPAADGSFHQLFADRLFKIAVTTGSGDRSGSSMAMAPRAKPAAKNRIREICTFGSVWAGDGDVTAYSAVGVARWRQVAPECARFIQVAQRGEEVQLAAGMRCAIHTRWRDAGRVKKREQQRVIRLRRVGGRAPDHASYTPAPQSLAGRRTVGDGKAPTSPAPTRETQSMRTNNRGSNCFAKR